MTTKALITEAVSGLFVIADLRTQKVLGSASGRGLLKRDGKRIFPGDFVAVSPNPEFAGTWLIEEVYARKNFLERPPLANLNQLNIVCAATVPELDYHLVDRMILLCFLKGIKPVIVISKTDQTGSQDGMQTIKNDYELAGIEIVYSSLEDETVHPFLLPQEPNQIVAFAGQSGVGKSTLVNRILPYANQETSNLIERRDRGKQTTKHTRLFPCKDGYIADTAGFWNLLLGKIEVTRDNVIKGYPELLALQGSCRFDDCTHSGEPGCALLSDKIIISEGRLKRYHTLLEEALKTWQLNMIKKRKY